METQQYTAHYQSIAGDRFYRFEAANLAIAGKTALRLKYHNEVLVSVTQQNVLEPIVKRELCFTLGLLILAIVVL